MAIFDFRIGAAPDFVMTMGKVIYPHRAEVELRFGNGAKSSETVTNPSLSALIVAINEKLVAIGWSRGDGYAWTAFAPVTAEVQGNQGIGIVVFKLREEMIAKHRPRMVKYMKDNFM